MAQPPDRDNGKSSWTAEELLEFTDQQAAEATKRDNTNGTNGNGERNPTASPRANSHRGRAAPDSSSSFRPGDRRPLHRYSEEREENNERRSRRSRGHSDDLSNDSDADRANRTSSRRAGPRHSPRPHDTRGLDSYRPREDGRVREPRRDDRRRDDTRRRSRSRSRSPRRDGGSRPPRERSPARRRQSTPPPTTDDRDRRTVFVQQIANRVRSRQVEKFFEAAGRVKEAQIVKDRVSGRSKGVGYVEFFEEESVANAINMTGQKLGGIPVIVQVTEAEKNRQSRAVGGAGTLANGVPFHRLYVGNVHFNVTDQMLREIFASYGDIENLVIQKDDNKRSKGYGFVQYKLYSSAKSALNDLNGFDIAGRPIRVGLGSDKFTNESTESLLQRFDAQAEAHEQSQRQPAAQGSSFSGLGGRPYNGGMGGGGGNREKDKHASNASALDDADLNGEGMNYAKYDRHDLMSKLSRTNREEKTAPKPERKKEVVAAPDPTRCLLVKNCFKESDVATKEGRDEIEADFKGEAENNFGTLLHSGIGGDISQGEVYLKFQVVAGATKAYRNLNGRFFDGKMLSADYISETIYNMNFPNAPK